MSLAPAESCPTRFPIFPLRGVVLLPGGNLPLNIFEPRYLQMVRDAMQTDRVIGMVQPKRDDDASSAPETFRTGCLGAISNFAETDDGRFLITLTGQSRFDVVEELAVTTPYRQVVADFSRWHHDQQLSPPPDQMRQGLLDSLKRYFAIHEIRAEWSGIELAPLTGLVTSLAMICPFAPSEKQALLEAADLERQTKILIALLQMDTLQGGDGERMKH